VQSILTVSSSRISGISKDSTAAGAGVQLCTLHRLASFFPALVAFLQCCNLLLIVPNLSGVFALQGLELVFVAVYQKALKLLYVDQLLERMKAEFVLQYDPKVLKAADSLLQAASTFCSLSVLSIAMMTSSHASPPKVLTWYAITGLCCVR